MVSHRGSSRPPTDGTLWDATWAQEPTTRYLAGAPVGPPGSDGSRGGVLPAHQQPPDATIDDRGKAYLRTTSVVQTAGLKILDLRCRGCLLDILPGQYAEICAC